MLALITLAAAAVATPSFDCAKASHPLERTICADAALARADGDLAKIYRAQLAKFFNRNAVVEIQREWQSKLRADCTQKCDRTKVAASYAAQTKRLNGFYADEYEASYKTADIATLIITHSAPGRLDFGIVRTRDEGEAPLCTFPDDESDTSRTAIMRDANTALWTGGACTIDLVTRRDRNGHVNTIDVSASKGCARYCRTPYGLSDSYTPSGLIEAR